MCLIDFFGSRLQSWNSYQRGRGYIGGEAYASASYDYILRHVMRCTVRFHRASLPPPRESKFGLLILDGYPSRIYKIPPHMRPSVRVLHWWSNRTRTRSPHLWIPYRDPMGTFVPYFVHAALLKPNPTPDKIPNSILLLGKSCRFMNARIIHTLHKNHFFLRSLRSCPTHNVTGITNQKKLMRPSDFGDALGRFKFLVGFGKPLDSPTPLEALARSVIVVLPPNQHILLRDLGPPHVHTYTSETHLMLILKRDLRVSSFVPHDYTPKGAIARMHYVLRSQSNILL